MNRNKYWLGLVAFLLPLLFRLLWFYNGIPVRPKIATPEFDQIQMPQPALATLPAQKAVEMTGKTVVIDFMHGNQYESSEIQPLVESLNRSGARVETSDGTVELEEQLRYASAFVVISPTISFSNREIQQVQSFVHNGGRLLVLSDATRGVTNVNYDTGYSEFVSDVNSINSLLSPFDLAFNFDYLYNILDNEGNFRNVYFTEFGNNALTAGLKKVALYGTHSVETLAGTPVLLADKNTFSSLTDSNEGGIAAAALSPDGNVLAMGDFTFLSSPYNEVEDNGTLLTHVAAFLLGGERKPTLTNFPYLFSQPTVSVLPAGDVQLTAETFTTLAGVQAKLQGLGAEMRLVDKAPRSGDVLVLGTFSTDSTLSPYLDKFDITLDDFSSFIEIPDYGKVGRDGIGLLLYAPSENGNTLVMLTAYAEDLPTLFSSVEYGLTSSCVLQGNIGVCSIGYGGSFSEEPTYDFSETPTLEPTPEGGQEVTPTPSG